MSYHNAVLRGHFGSVYDEVDVEEMMEIQSIIYDLLSNQNFKVGVTKDYITTYFEDDRFDGEEYIYKLSLNWFNKNK